MGDSSLPPAQLAVQDVLLREGSLSHVRDGVKEELLFRVYEGFFEYAAQGCGGRVSRAYVNDIREVVVHDAGMKITLGHEVLDLVVATTAELDIWVDVLQRSVGGEDDDASEDEDAGHAQSLEQ